MFFNDKTIKIEYEVIGFFFFDLDIGLSVEELRGAIRACQSGVSDYQEITLNAVNRRGKTISCRVVSTPLSIATQQHGVILLMEEMTIGAIEGSSKSINES